MKFTVYIHAPRRINMTNSTDTDNIMTSPYFVYFIKTHLLPKKDISSWTE